MATSTDPRTIAEKNEMSVKYMIQGFLDYSKNSMKGCLDKETNTDDPIMNSDGNEQWTQELMNLGHSQCQLNCDLQGHAIKMPNVY